MTIESTSERSQLVQEQEKNVKDAENGGMTHQFAKECFAQGTCPFSSNPKSWTIDTLKYLVNGPLQFMGDRLKVQDRQSYVAFVILQIAHRTNCFITHPQFIQQLMEAYRDSDTLSGGYQFHGPLTEMIGPSNPLTEEDIDRHDDVKDFCYQHQFNRALIKKENFINMLHTSQDFIDCYLKKDQQQLDFSWLGSKYTLTMALRYLLEVEVEVNDELVQLLYDLEQRVSAKMTYEPFTYVPDQINARYFIEAKGFLQDCAEKLLDKKLLEEGTGILSLMAKAPKYTEKEISTLLDVKNSIIPIDALLKKRRLSRIFREKLQQHDLDKTFDPTINAEKALELVDEMLEDAESNPKRFDESQLNSMAKTCMVIGSGAIKSTLVSMLYLLVKHPDYTNKLKEHLKKLPINIPSKEEFATYSQQEQQKLNQQFFECLSTDSMLRNLLKETYRLYPAVSVVARTPKKDLQLGKYTVKAGTQIYGSSYHMNRDESCYVKGCEDDSCNDPTHCWIDPLEFNPDRFNVEKTPLNAPFNLKYSKCLGAEYANAEIYAFIYLLLTEVKIEWGYDEDFELEAVAGILLKFNKPLLIHTSLPADDNDVSGIT